MSKSKSYQLVQPQVFVANVGGSENREDDYLLFERILREFKFKRELDRVIIQLRSKGHTTRAIQNWLKYNLQTNLSHAGIGKIILRVKEEYMDFLKGLDRTFIDENDSLISSIKEMMAEASHRLEGLGKKQPISKNVVSNVLKMVEAGISREECVETMVQQTLTGL